MKKIVSMVICVIMVSIFTTGKAMTEHLYDRFDKKYEAKIFKDMEALGQTEVQMANWLDLLLIDYYLDPEYWDPDPEIIGKKMTEYLRKMGADCTVECNEVGPGILWIICFSNTDLRELGNGFEKYEKKIYGFSILVYETEEAMMQAR